MLRLALLLVTIIVVSNCQLAQPLKAADKTTQPTPDKPLPPLTPIHSDKPLNTFSLVQRPYADEDKDFGTAPFTSLIPLNWTAKTPITLPGAKRITTHELWTQLTAEKKRKPIIINVLGGTASEAIEGSVWLSGAGQFGRMNDLVQQRLADHLQRLSANDKRRTVVFYCLGIDCWSSYNAGQRAIALGYRKVYWYRGGLRAWYAAGLPTKPTLDDRW